MRVRSMVGVTGFVLATSACFDYEEPVAANGTKPVNRPDTSSSDDTVTGPLTTWHEHVRPLVENHCVGCHASGDSVAIPLDSFAATDGFRQRMIARVNRPLSQGDELPMPPWLFDPTCREVADAHLLSAIEKAVFTAWGATGFTEGDPNRYVPPTRPPSADPGARTVILSRAEGYTPSRATPDDHRCFVFPEAFAVDTWVTAVEVTADQPELVHRVALFVVPEGELATLTALDEAGPGPGYPCFGGSGASEDTLLAAWAPGMKRPIVFPPNTAYRIPAGSRVVARIHYHLGESSESQVPSDRTGAVLWAMVPNQIPLEEVHIRPVADRDLFIASGDPDAVADTSEPSPFSETIVGVVPHMHLLGESLSLEVERAGSPIRECLARLPRWEPRWQQTFMFSQPAQVELNLGDRLHLRCNYDNSAANQPLIDGQPRPPQDVAFGPGRFDEMCLAYVISTTPVFGSRPPANVCDGFAACMRDVCAEETCRPELCSDEGALCALDCMRWLGQGCVDCALRPFYSECATAETCKPLRDSLSTCEQARCGAQGYFECLVNSCRSELDALHSCLEPYIESGACAAAAPTCGLGLSTGR